MTAEDLKEHLKKALIPENRYSIGSMDPKGGISLMQKKDGAWTVSQKKGHLDMSRTFYSEGEACAYMERQLVKPSQA